MTATDSKHISGLLSPWIQDKRVSRAVPFLCGRVLDFGCGAGILADYVNADHYVGVDHDNEALGVAQGKYPKHQFVSDLPDESPVFDTVVSLAVIEHIAKPEELLQRFAALLKDDGAIVLTTPHPHFHRIHDMGAMVGLFSKDAADDHEVMFNRKDLAGLAQRVGFQMVEYQRFLFGANQLCVFRRR
jgi:2-polyprenyl-3-methyl-5-hydroxy-6-metoxy-1,4-benzoquinol methylase